MRGPIKGARLAGIPLVRQRFKRECADLLTKGSYCFEIRTDGATGDRVHEGDFACRGYTL